MKKVIIIEGMSCEHCVKRVRKELEKLENVNVLSVEIGKAVIEGDVLKDEAIKEAIDEAGYDVKEIKDEDEHHENIHESHGHHMKHKKMHHKGHCH
ncbi:heavy-metal-associated domain-containing protein [Marinitoga aeolica]|uniref:Heavy-metal-associated domain-containing protein n=1 Tax=Marinitoga aeolica TaxID=2809031 RepID=A0ABY8PTF7_9BACT|nr:heavy-metal-associated domain-containing protein [Marinitoga aeolica]WGS65928.1 heavy-metal-associated domain-containing protein [Marinitoga aeolica]